MLPTTNEKARLRSREPPPVISPGFELRAMVPARTMMSANKPMLEVRDRLMQHLATVLNVYQPELRAAVFPVPMPPAEPRDPLRKLTAAQLEAIQNPDSNKLIIQAREPTASPAVHVQSIINVNHGTFTIDAFYRHGPTIMLTPRGRTNVVAATVTFMLDRESARHGSAWYLYDDNAISNAVPRRQTREQGRLTFEGDVREVLRMIEFY